MNSTVKMALFLYLLASFSVSVAGLVILLGGSPGVAPGGTSTPSVYLYLHFACAGAAGGSLYALRLFHQYYDSLTLRFVYWYAMRPLLCAGTGIITVILFESGILLLQVSDSLYAKIGLAFLSGLGYGKFMEKLTALADTLFNGKTGGGHPPHAGNQQ